MPSLSRCGKLTTQLAATAQSVPSKLRSAIPDLVEGSSKIVLDQSQIYLNKSTMAGLVRSHGSNLTSKAIKGLAATSQMRYSHTDIKFPDYDAYRRPSLQNSSVKSHDSHSSRVSFSYIFSGAALAGTLYGAKSLVTEFAATWSPSADVLAVAKIEVNLSDIPEGKSAVFKWRNKPLFIRHRTAEEIESEAQVDVSSLRDPQHDSDRAQRPEWLIVLGVCTHLGCVPVDGLGDFGGYYCPCHGSHYDASGRIRKGPAPLNLEVPNYEFTTDELVVVG